MKDLRSGIEHLTNPADASLFRLISPTDAWQSRNIDAEQQQVRLDRHGNHVTIEYAGLKTAPVDTDGNCDRLDMRVIVTLDLAPGADEVMCQMTLDNRSDAAVTEAWFPRLGGWTGYAGPAHDRLTPGYQGYFDRLNPHDAVIGLDWTTFIRGHRRWAVRYPLATMLPWMDLSGGGRGLWIINYMQEAYLGGFAAENVAAGTGVSLTFGWFATVEIAPGSQWTSQRFGIGLHSQDWHAPAHRYRDWLKTWWTQRVVRPPARLRRALGIQHVMFSSFDGEPMRSFSDLPAVARAGLKYGIADVCVWDGHMMGTYGRVNKTDLTDYPAPKWEALRQALAEVRVMGVSASMLINQRLVSPTCDFYTRRGSPGVMRMRDGSVRPEPTPVGSRTAEIFPQWMGPMAVAMCQRSDEFRQEVNHHLDRLLDVGFSAFFIDQSFEYLPCYAENHGHTRVDDTHMAAIEWISDFRRRMKERNPDSYLMGEMPDVFTPQAIDLLWNWNWFRRNPDIMAYSLPEMSNAWVSDRDVSAAQNGFLYGLMLMLTTNGFTGTLDDAPDFGAYIQKLGALRSRTADLTVLAQFEDMDGLSCEGATGRRFTYGDGSGDSVVLINPTDKTAKAQVRVDPLRARTPAASRLYRLDGTTETLPASGESAVLELSMAPRDVIVWDMPG